MKKTFVILLFLGFNFLAFAQGVPQVPNLSSRFVKKAENMMKDGDIAEAYRTITAAMKSSKTSENDQLPIELVEPAKRIYGEYLKQVHLSYIDLVLFDVEQNLMRFPELKSDEINILIDQLQNRDKLDSSKYGHGRLVSLEAENDYSITVGNRLGEEISFKEPDSKDSVFFDKTIVKAVLPYQDGFVIKFTNNFVTSTDYFAASGSVFYVKNGSGILKCEITDITSNEFNIKVLKY